MAIVNLMVFIADYIYFSYYVSKTKLSLGEYHGD